MDGEGQVRLAENPLLGYISKEASPISPDSGFPVFLVGVVVVGTANHSPSHGCRHGIQTLVYPGVLTGNSSSLG